MLKFFSRFILSCLMCFILHTGTYGVAGYKPDQIPESLILIGNDDGKTEYAVVVEKSAQQMILYAYDGEYSEVSRYRCSTGKSQGSKMREGDAKTPEGVYFFIQEHKKEALSPIYGTRAFPTDYPNETDQAAGRTGNAIWMHGTNKPLVDFDSNGCIVLENADIDQVANYIVLNRTPVIIVDKILYKSAEDILKEREDILNWLSKRNQAIQTGTYHDYLGFYSPDYLPDMSWWREWTAIRKQNEPHNRFLEIHLNRIQILKFDHTVVIIGDQYLKDNAGGEINTGKRKFYAEIGKKPYGIFSESHVSATRMPGLIPGKELLTAAVQQPAPKTEDDQEITKLIDDWLNAWSSKDIARYGEFYADDFISGNMGRAEWLKYKNRLNAQNEFIRVAGEDVSISRTKTLITVSFLQKYESSSYKAVGKKQLILKQEEGKWKIRRETWTSR